jgi:mannose-6-phosphate isomerase-like protein (cupin superfamily)
MKVKNVRKTEYFTSTDRCRITETFGLPTEKIKEASVAFAILPPAQATDAHHHNFLEWYIVTAGKAEMTIGAENREVGIGDNILIPKGEWHSIRNTGPSDLEFYCFCVPAFTLEGTTMKDGSEAKESLERKFS